MALLSTTPQRLDTDRDYQVTITDRNGQAIAFASGDALAAVLTRGAGQPAVLTAPIAWSNAAAGVALLSLNAADLAGAAVTPGTWRVEVTVTPTDPARPLEAWTGSVQFVGSAAGHPAESTLTRRGVELALIRRAGRLMTLAGLDGTSAVGGNPDLADPIAVGLRSVGVTPADPTDPADADFATVLPSSVPQLLDVAELRALENVLGHLDQPDQQQGADRQDWGKLAERLERTIARKAAALARTYGLEAGTLAAGTIALGFTQPDPGSGD